MKLNDECLDSLKFRAFWEKETRPSIMRFLTYRLLSSELEDEETEHSCYSSELHKISLHYPDANSDIGRKVAKLKRTFKASVLIIRTIPKIMLCSTVINYPAGCGLQGNPISSLTSLSVCNPYKKTKNSKQIKQFWELHMAKERAALENQATKTISELQINTLLHKDTVTHSTAVSELARSKITFAVQELDPLNINDSEVLNAQLKRKSASDSPCMFCLSVQEILLHNRYLIHAKQKKDLAVIPQLCRHHHHSKQVMFGLMTMLSPIFADPDHDVFLQWSNKEAPESKARKLTGRAKQPDAIISNVDQLSWGSSRGHGEAKVQEEVDNLYSLCTDLIWIAVFNKDAIDFYNKDCMLGFQVIGSHITFYLSTLLYDSLYVMVEIGHLNVPMSLEQLPAFITSLDTLLVVSNAFWTNCAMSHPVAEMEPNKRNTLATPNFKELIAKSRDRHRPCQL
ncbi:10438_t:CDS:2 [Paraglomus occultum]|uniref:10438_t:CDS:1 n=1 Tax=Paraglomus occultum TaxID=144539 RepID=A0A9N9A0Y4_9GLOM|nr:10438_t:CDS:2 [Paraglomus occultum]